MLQIAETVLTIGFITLKQAFTMAFPTVTYTQFNAKRLLLQMPLVCLRLDYKHGKSECILIEYHDGVNYKNLLQLLQNVIPSAVVDTKMDKSLLRALLGLCQSDRERESIRYAVFKVSGFTSTQARTQFGFQNMTQRAKKVEDSLSHAHYIHTAIEKLAVTTEKAVLKSFGLSTLSDELSSDSSDEEADEPTNHDQAIPS